MFRNEPTTVCGHHTGRRLAIGPRNVLLAALATLIEPPPKDSND
jgi:glucose/arabinose dehydrogenase